MFIEKFLIFKAPKPKPGPSSLEKPKRNWISMICSKSVQNHTSPTSCRTGIKLYLIQD